ncbi:MAG TPA: hypothetical protein PKC41_01165 [Chitinophagaceae bacterium]|jgi:hypothetical protein|nr:hypothetical protein [Chitinophagaceae bacterium]
MKTLSYFILCTLFFVQTNAKSKGLVQQKNYMRAYYDGGGFDPDNLILGGNLGMNFFKKGYTAYIAPTIGYSFGRFQLGVSAGYNFYHEKLAYINSISNLPEDYPYSASDYNVSLFTRLALLGPVFLHAEPGYGFYKVMDSVSYELTTGKLVEHTSRFSVPYVLVGGGFAFPIGERVSFVIYALYDVIQNKLSPYSGLPVIRGGFNVGSFR